MKVVYASRTGNVEALIGKLGITDALHIEDGTEKVSGRSVSGVDGGLYHCAPDHCGLLCPHGQCGQFYAGQPDDHRPLQHGVCPQPDSGGGGHGHLPGAGVPGGILPLPPAHVQAAHHADAGDAAHVDELPSAYLRLDEPSGEKRHHQPHSGPGGAWPL